MLELRNVSFLYSDTKPENSCRFLFNFTLPKPGIHAVTGISGIGKTTLLYILAGFYPVHAGNIVFNGLELTGLRSSDRPVSMIFQGNNLFSHFTALENICLGILKKIRPGKILDAQIRQFLENAGLDECANKYPDSLSDGQCRRIALVREIMRIEYAASHHNNKTKQILLLDEPFNGLDQHAGAQFKQLLQNLRQKYSLTLLFSSHNQDDINGFAENTVRIYKKPPHQNEYPVVTAELITV